MKAALLIIIGVFHRWRVWVLLFCVSLLCFSLSEFVRFVWKMVLHVTWKAVAVAFAVFSVYFVSFFFFWFKKCILFFCYPFLWCWMLLFFIHACSLFFFHLSKQTNIIIITMIIVDIREMLFPNSLNRNKLYFSVLWLRNISQLYLVLMPFLVFFIVFHFICHWVFNIKNGKKKWE